MNFFDSLFQAISGALEKTFPRLCAAEARDDLILMN